MRTPKCFLSKGMIKGILVSYSSRMELIAATTMSFNNLERNEIKYWNT